MCVGVRAFVCVCAGATGGKVAGVESSRQNFKLKLTLGLMVKHTGKGLFCPSIKVQGVQVTLCVGAALPEVAPRFKNDSLCTIRVVAS